MSIEKPENDFELLLHVAEDPVNLLGAKSRALFEAFTFGYTWGRPAGTTFTELNRPDFEEFVRQRFPISER
jgi:hypothetical protein